MKTTVKAHMCDVVVQPSTIANLIDLNLVNPQRRSDGMPGYIAGVCLTPDQCGALIFGMEQALEVIDQRHRAALQTMRAAA